MPFQQYSPSDYCRPATHMLVRSQPPFSFQEKLRAAVYSEAADTQCFVSWALQIFLPGVHKVLAQERNEIDIMQTLMFFALAAQTLRELAGRWRIHAG
jgi:hypothetical protein